VTDRIHVVGLVVSILLLLIVLELVRRRKLTEEYSFVWIVFAAALVALSVRRDILDLAARWLGIYYPPVVLLLLLVLMVFVTSLGFAVIVSRQRKQIEHLIEETAILGAELQELRMAQSTAGKSTREPDQRALAEHVRNQPTA
jgi:hypothetical protein